MGEKAKLYMTTRPEALVICFSCFLLPLKLAERARVRASGSTAASSHAWLLRLSRSLPGYKKYAKKVDPAALIFHMQHSDWADI